MKAISLWQPWASLIVMGSKFIETRSWPTNYRGPLLIHAAKRWVNKEIAELLELEEFHAALHKLGDTFDSRVIDSLPRGAIVGKVDLLDCRRVESFTREEIMTKRFDPERDGYCWTEWDMGNYSPGRFGWVMSNPVQFEPISYRGEQGLFEVPGGILETAVRPLDEP